MTQLTFNNVVSNLQKYQSILTIINGKKLKSETNDIDRMISILKSYGDLPIDTFNHNESPLLVVDKKQSFQEIVELIFNKNFQGIDGIKLNYENFSDIEQIHSYFDQKPKPTIMRETTLLDLKLIYCILTNDKTERKGKKSDVYEAIKSNIRARKRGKAFSKIF
ncbi:hypothetical protein [Bacillus sp. Marseille-P3661]|uniref:hypothetical protein n=1 Tax=Bacillus sp. Marseille-P3661 TaxID=1936234 RepID=UPI000C83F0D5|nr:hypothetical protein [Bacillus sp. Marseille-P3661]